MNLINTLQHRAHIHPEQIALMDAHKGVQRSHTYGELWQRVCGGSEVFHQAGLRRGDTIVFLHPVSIELYEALLACLHAGMRAMFFDPSAETSFINKCCSIGEPKAFFGSPKAHLLRLKLKAIRSIKTRFHTGTYVPFSKRWHPPKADSAPSSTASDTHALITFTSGSTGQPKAIVRTHQFLLDQHKALEDSLDLRSGDIDLITLPIFTLANLASGVTSVLANTDLAKPGEADADRIAEQIQHTNTHRCSASPAFFESLLKRPDIFRDLETIYTGGAPVFPNLLDNIHTKNPNTKLISVYGSSEAEPIAHIDYKEISKNDREMMLQGRGLLVGHPVPQIDIAIIPDRNGDIIGPFSENDFAHLKHKALKPGEIVVSGKHVLKGYLNGIGDKETKFLVGETIWHRTGDAGQWDDSGRLFLLGRCKAKLPSTTILQEIYPFSIECAVSEFPKISRSAALLHESKRTLVIESVFDGKLLEDLKQKLSWAGIEQWIFVDKLPVDKRHNAKIDYGSLEALLETGKCFVQA